MERYDYLSTISSGAYGVVYRVYDNVTKKICAAKGIRQAHEDAEVLRMTLRELKVLRALPPHANVVQLLEAFRSQSGRVYMVFEYVPGNLYEEMGFHPRNALPPPLLQSVAWQLLRALQHCHANGLVHRDIKPSNILISDDPGATTVTPPGGPASGGGSAAAAPTRRGSPYAGRIIKLCDFGFARTSADGSAVTQTLAAGGDAKLSSYIMTRWYRPPEVLVGDVYGAPVDIWSYGVMLAELATGRPLFPGNSTVDQLWRVMRCMGPLPARQAAALRKDRRLAPLWASVPAVTRTLATRLAGLEPRLVSLITSCLDLEPLRRPTAVQLLEMPYFWDVRQVLGGTELANQLPYLSRDKSDNAVQSTVVPLSTVRTQHAAAERVQHAAVSVAAAAESLRHATATPATPAAAMASALAAAAAATATALTSTPAAAMVPPTSTSTDAAARTLQQATASLRAPGPAAAASKPAPAVASEQRAGSTQSEPERAKPRPSSIEPLAPASLVPNYSHLLSSGAQAPLSGGHTSSAGGDAVGPVAQAATAPVAAAAGATAPTASPTAGAMAGAAAFASGISPLVTADTCGAATSAAGAPRLPVALQLPSGPSGDPLLPQRPAGTSIQAAPSLAPCAESAAALGTIGAGRGSLSTHGMALDEETLLCMRSPAGAPQHSTPQRGGPQHAAGPRHNRALAAVGEAGLLRMDSHVTCCSSGVMHASASDGALACLSIFASGGTAGPSGIPCCATCGAGASTNAAGALQRLMTTHHHHDATDFFPVPLVRAATTNCALPPSTTAGGPAGGGIDTRTGGMGLPRVSDSSAAYMHTLRWLGQHAYRSASSLNASMASVAAVAAAAGLATSTSTAASDHAQAHEHVCEEDEASCPARAVDGTVHSCSNAGAVPPHQQLGDGRTQQQLQQGPAHLHHHLHLHLHTHQSSQQQQPSTHGPTAAVHAGHSMYDSEPVGRRIPAPRAPAGAVMAPPGTTFSCQVAQNQKSKAEMYEGGPDQPRVVRPLPSGPRRSSSAAAAALSNGEPPSPRMRGGIVGCMPFLRARRVPGACPKARIPKAPAAASGGPTAGQPRAQLCPWAPITSAPPAHLKCSSGPGCAPTSNANVIGGPAYQASATLGTGASAFACNEIEAYVASSAAGSERGAAESGNSTPAAAVPHGSLPPCGGPGAEGGMLLGPSSVSTGGASRSSRACCSLSHTATGGTTSTAFSSDSASGFGAFATASYVSTWQDGFSAHGGTAAGPTAGTAAAATTSSSFCAAGNPGGSAHAAPPSCGAPASSSSNTVCAAVSVTSQLLLYASDIMRAAGAAGALGNSVYGGHDVIPEGEESGQLAMMTSRPQRGPINASSSCDGAGSSGAVARSPWQHSPLAGQQQEQGPAGAVTQLPVVAAPAVKSESGACGSTAAAASGGFRQKLLGWRSRLWGFVA